MNPIRVFIVDEHKPSRTLARRVIKSTPGIVLVGEATSPFTVRKAVNDSKPDVLALNSSSRISRHFDGISNTINVPTVQMPQPGLDYNWHSIELHKVQFSKYSVELIDAIKNAVKNRWKGGHKKEPNNPVQRIEAEQRRGLQKKPVGLDGRTKIQGDKKRPKTSSGAAKNHPLIVIGAPGGDLDAMRAILLGLQFPLQSRSRATGILIAQQVPASFNQHYMESLREASMLPVLKATEGHHIQPGKILLAPSGRNIEIVKNGGRYYCQFSGTDKTPGRKPSLDLLFASLAENAGSMGIGILLLGVGSEGTEGLSRLRQVGANILVQENDSFSDDHMPSAAIMNGGAELIVPLNNIATKVTRIIQECP